jgi:hypothetical protein
MLINPKLSSGLKSFSSTSPDPFGPPSNPKLEDPVAKALQAFKRLGTLEDSFPSGPALGKEFIPAAPVEIRMIPLDNRERLTAAPVEIQQIYPEVPLPTRPTLVYVDTNNAVPEVDAIKTAGAPLGYDIQIVTNPPTSDAHQLGRGLEAVLARAQRGEINLQTLIISGHSDGVGGGGVNGGIYNWDFTQYQKKYPRAMAQVQNIVVMGCNSAHPWVVNDYRKFFPNTRVNIGFRGAGPGQAASAKIINEVLPLLKSAPSKQAVAANPKVGEAWAKKLLNAPSVRKQNTAVDIQGIKQQEPGIGHDGEQFAEQYKAQLEVFQNYRFARPGYELPPEDHQKGPLREFYNTAQWYVNFIPPEDQLSSNKAPGPDKREDVLRTKDQAIRLICFREIEARWSKEFAPQVAELNKDFARLGVKLVIPNFAGKTRAEVLDIIESVESEVGFNGLTHKWIGFLNELRDGLGNLNPQKIPIGWVADLV